MRIKNRYLRNKHARNKARKKIIKATYGGEHSYKYVCPYTLYHEICNISYDIEQQKKWHNETIEWKLRGRLNGFHRGSVHAPRWYRNIYHKKHKRAVKQILGEIIKNVDYTDDTIIPKMKLDADWDFF